MDADDGYRIAAFQRLKMMTRSHGTPLPWSAITQGMHVGGETVHLISPGEGIFKPRQMRSVLSIKTVAPKPGGRVWYADQVKAPGPRADRDADLAYSFKGTDPKDRQNLLLRDAWERSLPIIYFYGVAPGLYEPIFPCYVVGWDPDRLECMLAPGPEVVVSAGEWTAPSVPDRRYRLTQTRHRLHQAEFRINVVAAYGGRCALSNLPERRLLEAAHIVDDGDDALGQPDVRNGILMSRLHHGAYDAGILGIDPDGRVHVARELLDMNDGPMLEALKGAHGLSLRPPRDQRLAPDRDRLARKYESFIR